MLGFSKFIEESLNTSYSLSDPKVYSSKIPGGTYTRHTYNFKDKFGNSHSIHFTHNTHIPDHAEVTFHQQEGNSAPDYDANSKHGHHAIKIFSTAKNAMEKYSKDNPHIKTLKYTSDKNVEYNDEGTPVGVESSRSKLYRNFTKKAGGETEEGKYTLIHHIPVNREK